MANIKLNLDYPIYDGIGITFKAPCDCTGASGLKICHLGGEQVFTFRDSHNNNLADIGNVFVKGAFVKVVLDIAGSNAYIQNADNNAYLHKTIRWGECDGSIEVGETAKAVTPDSVAVGTNNVAGCKGYYISAIDTTNKYVYLTREKTADPVITTDGTYYDATFETPAYEVGDEFSIINGKHYAFCGKVSSITHNRIAYTDALPFSSIESGGNSADEYADGIWVFSNDVDDAWIDCIPNQYSSWIYLHFPHGFGSSGQKFNKISFYKESDPNLILYDDTEVYNSDEVPMYCGTGYRTVVIPNGTRWEDIVVEGDTDDESAYHEDIVADIKAWFNNNAIRLDAPSLADGTWVFGDEDKWIDYFPAQNDYEGTVYLHLPVGFTSNGEEFHTISIYYNGDIHGMFYDDLEVFCSDWYNFGYWENEAYRSIVIPEGTHWDDIVIEYEEMDYYDDISIDVRSWFVTNAKCQNSSSFDNKNHILFVPTKANIGNIEDVFFGAVVLGRDNVGAGANIFVAGYKNMLSGDYGFITGHNNKGGYACDITGEDNTDKGNNNHIEGAQNEVTGDFVHVEGKGNVGAGDVQHIEGKYNAPDETSARIVGGGSSDADRRNIETLDWLGNLWVRGKVYVGGNDISESVALALASDLGLEIVTGSYTGAGSKYTKTLTFDISPKLVIIAPCNTGSLVSTPAVIIRPCTSIVCNQANITPVEWGDASVTLGENLSTSPDYIYDKSGVQYMYVALGYAN